MPESTSYSLQPIAQRAPALLDLLFVILIGLTAARLFWLLWPAPDLPAMTRAAGTHSTHNEQAVKIDQIAGANLFGQEQTSTRPEQSKVINAPETHLNLTLTGIVSSNNGQASRALIENENHKQKSYAIGDTITNHVKLHAIYSNRVILDRSGRYETLTLEREKNDKALKRVDSGTVSPQLAQNLAQARNQILQNPSQASRYLRIQPQRRNGQLQGYRIYPGSDRTLFKKAGLRPGELVTKLNGVPLNNPGQALKTLGDLAHASSVTVTLKRGGQERTMTVNFR